MNCGEMIDLVGRQDHFVRPNLSGLLAHHLFREIRIDMAWIQQIGMMCQPRPLGLQILQRHQMLGPLMPIAGQREETILADNRRAGEI